MADDDVTYTVGDLNRLVRRVLNRRFPDAIWVEGEMRGLKRHAASGHVYFELADTSADGRQTDAVIQVALYRTDKDAVNRSLRRAGAVRMDDGIHIRIRGTLDYYPPQGRLQFRMQGIDPTYTLGRLEAERQRLVAALASEDLLGRNRALPYPMLPLHVGLITSPGSAAQEDFLHELGTSGLAWRVKLAGSSVQGPNADVELVAALHTLAAADVDVIALVRGGGARTDLAAFDSELLVRTVAALGVPVLTGIGHETDQAVADLVAARPSKTPTACAALLVRDATAAHDRALRTWDAISAISRLDLERAGTHLDERARRVGSAGRRHLDQRSDELDAMCSRVARLGADVPAAAQRQLDRQGAEIAASARRGIDQAGAAAAEQRRRLVSSAPRAVRRSEKDLTGFSARVRAADPARLLALGWSITRWADGTPLANTRDIQPGTELVTRVADGTIRSTVTATHPDTDMATHPDIATHPDTDTEDAA